MPGDKQSREIFLQAVAEQAQLLSKSTGIPAAKIQLLLITNAGLEGGTGETTAVGTLGYQEESHGRYQFNTATKAYGWNLLKNGWTVEDFYDDAKVVENWAPYVLGFYQQELAAGNSGGDAMRQAIFKAEHPKEMYKESALNGALSNASSILGDQTPSATGSIGTETSPGAEGGGGGNVESFQEDVRRALEAWQADPQNLNLKDVFEDASDRYEAAQGLFDTDSGSKALSDSIALGDFTRREAESKFGMWLDKERQATTLAIAEVNNRKAANEETRAQEAARAELGKGGPVLRGSGTYRYPQAFNDVLDKYREKLAGQAGGGGGTPTGAAAPGGESFRPDYDEMVRKPSPEPAWSPSNPWDDPKPGP